ncbi:hypothetical protein [Burkholderia gladioli]|uniref:hypothetical protein n=1 Tax=Burkholderia gladioli TaxID=28095 RepID=UPI001FC8B283|nr:hypothetical protein [Burkholderia gladioli]
MSLASQIKLRDELPHNRQRFGNAATSSRSQARRIVVKRPRDVLHGNIPGFRIELLRQGRPR